MGALLRAVPTRCEWRVTRLSRVRTADRCRVCVGEKPPFDHPHVFLDMGDANEIIRPYCSTLFRYDPGLDPHAARPAECALRDLTPA